MQKTSLIFTNVLLLMSAQVSADGLNCREPQCQNKKAYIFLKGGKSFLSEKPDTSKAELYYNKPDSSYLYGVGFGYKLNDSAKIGLAVFHRPNYYYNSTNALDIENQEISNFSHMLEAYFTTFQYANIKQYVTAGFGLSYNIPGNFNDLTDEQTHIGKGTHSFAWLLGAGIIYKINNCLSLDVGYRYTDLGGIRIEDWNIDQVDSIASTKRIDGKIKAHEIIAGIEYSF